MTTRAVSKHIGVLEAAGLVTRGRDAQRRPSRIRTERLVDIDTWLDVPPPNEVRGKAAYRETWPPFFAHALLRCGTDEELRKDPDNRLRLTIGLRKLNGQWAVAHEHHWIPLQSSE